MTEPCTPSPCGGGPEVRKSNAGANESTSFSERRYAISAVKDFHDFQRVHKANTFFCTVSGATLGADARQRGSAVTVTASNT